MKNIYAGNLNADKLFIGASKADKVYVGNALVWQSAIPLGAPRVTLAGSKLRIYDDDGRAESYSIYSGDELLTVVPKAEV